MRGHKNKYFEGKTWIITDQITLNGITYIMPVYFMRAI